MNVYITNTSKKMIGNISMRITELQEIIDELQSILNLELNTDKREFIYNYINILLEKLKYYQAMINCLSIKKIEKEFKKTKGDRI